MQNKANSIFLMVHFCVSQQSINSNRRFLVEVKHEVFFLREYGDDDEYRLTCSKT